MKKNAKTKKKERMQTPTCCPRLGLNFGEFIVSPTETSEPLSAPPQPVPEVIPPAQLWSETIQPWSETIRPWSETIQPLSETTQIRPQGKRKAENPPVEQKKERKEEQEEEEELSPWSAFTWKPWFRSDEKPLQLPKGVPFTPRALLPPEVPSPSLETPSEIPVEGKRHKLQILPCGSVDQCCDLNAKDLDAFHRNIERLQELDLAVLPTTETLVKNVTRVCKQQLPFPFASPADPERARQYRALIEKYWGTWLTLARLGQLKSIVVTQIPESLTEEPLVLVDPLLVENEGETIQEPNFEDALNLAQGQLDVVFPASEECLSIAKGISPDIDDEKSQWPTGTIFEFDSPTQQLWQRAKAANLLDPRVKQMTCYRLPNLPLNYSGYSVWTYPPPLASPVFDNIFWNFDLESPRAQWEATSTMTKRMENAFNEGIDLQTVRNVGYEGLTYPPDLVSRSKETESEWERSLKLWNQTKFTPEKRHKELPVHMKLAIGETLTRGSPVVHGRS